jgi:glucokinase
LSQPLAIGIDIGGTQLRVALVDGAGSIRKRTAVRTEAGAGPAAVIAQIAGLVAEVVGEIDRSALLGAGVSCPGPLDTITGTALGIPTLAGWSDIPVAAMIEAALQLPVRLENDGIAAANGEWRFGAGRGLDNLVYVTVSTGIGGGIVADGHLIHGRRGMAGHIGHMIVARDGAVCSCGNRGCWEAYASGTAFAAAAAKAAGAKGPFPEAKAVFDAAREGDTVALSIVAEEAEWLGVGLISLVHLYSPQKIIIGGGLANGFDLLAPGIAKRLAQGAMPAFRDVEVAPATLGDNPGLIGAAALWFSHQKFPTNEQERSTTAA